MTGASGTHELLAWLTRRRLAYSVDFSLPGDLDSIQAKLATIPADLWEPAYDADGQLRPGASVAEVTGLFNLTWPDRMRVIVRKERPHPGAQLRTTDLDGHRITAFVTNATKGQLVDLELRHRRRARCEDRCSWSRLVLVCTHSPSFGTAANTLLNSPFRASAYVGEPMRSSWQCKDRRSVSED